MILISIITLLLLGCASNLPYADIDDVMKKEYKFTYITEERVLKPGYPRLEWRDKSEVPRNIEERAFSNIKKLVNAIIKKESR